MLELKAGPLLAALNQLSSLGQLLAVLSQQNTGLVPSRENFDLVKENADAFHETCVELGPRLCAVSADRINFTLAALDAETAAGEPVKIDHEANVDLRPSLTEIQGRTKDELATRACLTIPADRAHLYEQKQPLFGDNVANKFPNASFDIEEAGKCLALERYTASVFHMMRVVEIGIHALANVLEVELNPNS